MSPEIIKLMVQGIEETLFMVSVSTVIAAIVGIPLGITLVTTSKGHILQNRVINQILGTIVNIIRSIPFIILMVAIIPLTRIIAGSSIGTTAACVPLTLVAIPFLSRLVETSIRDVDFGLIEAAESMGATPLQIIRKVLCRKRCRQSSTISPSSSSISSGHRQWQVPLVAVAWGILPSAMVISGSSQTLCLPRSSSSSLASISSSSVVISLRQRKTRNKI